MSKILFLVSFTILSVFTYAQTSFHGEQCATSIMVQDKIASNPEIKEKREGIELKVQQWIKNNPKAKTEEIISIPVVIHILYRNASENISDAQIQSQIDVLNEDFRKLNTNFPATPAPFKTIAADCELEFCLAKFDPLGNDTTGITRTSVSNSFNIFNNYFSTVNGGQDPWDNSRYVNIWVGELGPGLLGFATPPGTATGNDDGLVIDDEAFGRIGTAANNLPAHLGRTATHEMGHYFDLEHVWGLFGGCSNDDLVSDTPLQNRSSFGCPSFPRTDNCTTMGDGIMFSNYMDYTNDACMTMFTEGQKQRMIAAINTSRSGLLNTTLCTTNQSGVSLIENPAKDFQVSPNPASDFINVNTQQLNLGNYTLSIYSASGKLVSHQTIDVIETKIDISRLKKGLYLIKASNNKQTYTTTLIK